MEIKRSDNNGLTIEFSGYTLMFTWNEIEIMSAERDKWYGLQGVMDYITNEAGFYEVGLLEAFPAVVDDKAFIDEVLTLYLRYKYEAESDNDYARGWRYCLEDALKEVGEKHPVYKTWIKAYM